MESIGAAKFKEQCLLILDQLGPEGLIITKRGKPVAKIVPYPEECANLIGSLSKELQIEGDVFSTGLSWESHS